MDGIHRNNDRNDRRTQPAGHERYTNDCMGDMDFLNLVTSLSHASFNLSYKTQKSLTLMSHLLLERRNEQVPRSKHDPLAKIHRAVYIQ